MIYTLIKHSPMHIQSLILHKRSPMHIQSVYAVVVTGDDTAVSFKFLQAKFNNITDTHAHCLVQHLYNVIV